MKIAIKILSLFVIAIVLSNWLDFVYKIRFYNVYYNYLVYTILCVLLPLSVFSLSALTNNNIIKISGLSFAAVSLMPALILAFFANIETNSIKKQGSDPSFKLLDQAINNKITYRLYRTDCGATCAYGLSLQKEIDTSLGIKFVYPVWSIYKQSEGLLVTNGGFIQVVSNNKILYSGS
jgi:hypothetical protein